MPWDRGAPHPLLVESVAFDITETAVRVAQRRFPGSALRYLVADLLDPPAEWHGAFNLVIESLTVQALPDALRPDAIARVGEMVAPGGTLLVIAAARDEGEPAPAPPWPLTRAEIDAFATGGLEAVRVEDLRDLPAPGERRWRAEFARRQPAERFRRCGADGCQRRAGEGGVVRMEAAFLPVRADFRSAAGVMPVGAAFFPSRPSDAHRDGRNAG